MGGILGGMEVVGLLGMISHCMGEPLPLWGFYLSFGFIIIPIIFIIIMSFGGKTK